MYLCYIPSLSTNRKNNPALGEVCSIQHYLWLHGSKSYVIQYIIQNSEIYLKICQMTNPQILLSFPAHGKVYSIHYYVIKCVNYLYQLRWFSPGTPHSSSNKTDRHDITEIVLKVALNTITLSYVKPKYHTVGTVPKSNRKIIETGEVDTPNTQRLDTSLSWLCTGTSIRKWRV